MPWMSWPLFTWKEALDAKFKLNFNFYNQKAQASDEARKHSTAECTMKEEYILRIWQLVCILMCLV